MKSFLKKFVSIVLSALLIAATYIPINAEIISEGERSEMVVSELMVDNEISPLGIDNETPKFSWKLTSEKRNVSQSAYRIIVSEKADMSELVWDSEKTEDSASIAIKYKGSALKPETVYYWKAYSWDNEGKLAESSVASFETALFEDSDWSNAEWIGANAGEKAKADISLTGAYWIWHNADGAYWNSIPECTRYFRKTFSVDSVANVVSAFVATTADDEYDLYLNGTLVSSSERVPNSWKTAQYAEITEFLVSGENVIAVKAKNNLGAGGVQTGGGLLSKLVVKTKSGEISVPSDSSWLTSDTELENWKNADFDDSEWTVANAQRQYGASPWGSAVSIATDDSDANPAPYLRKEINLEKEVKKARAYVCGLGYFVMSIDGKRVGNNVLDPGTTVYNDTALYVTHDVTDYLTSENHAIGINLGRGFYSLPSADTIYWNDVSWLGEPRLRFKLKVEYTDGTSETIISDTSWKTADSPILRDSLYMGETYDARNEQENWDKAEFDDSAWKSAKNLPAPTSNLVSQRISPIRVLDTMSASEVTEIKAGHYVLKYPVVTAGWAKITVSGNAGDKVVLTYGEKLRSDGTVNNDGSSGLTTGPIQVDTYILKGAESETWEPQFSYKGFQYIEVEGYNGTKEDAKANILARIVHSDVNSAGTFVSSNDILNKIHEMTLRTMLNNTHSIITDTPMYEKRGWLGDANVMAKSTVNNFDMQVFYRNWLLSIKNNMSSSGGGSEISPNKNDGWTKDVIWGGAIIGIPYVLYREYGDIGFIEDNYSYMMWEINYLKNSRMDSEGLITESNYGDWLSPNAENANGSYHKPPESTALINTAYAYKYALIMKESAELLGKDQDAKNMESLAESLKTNFNNKWLNIEKGIYETSNGESYRQTSNAVPLMFGLVPAEYEEIVAENLAKNVIESGYKVNAGFAGIKELYPALSKYGYSDEAFLMASGTDFPSYGYWIEHGATTLWEMWSENSRSLDHNLHGSVDDWFYSYLGGISANSAGYKEIKIEPYLPEGLNSAKASIASPYGNIESGWEKLSQNELKFEVTIPVNTSAKVYLPADAEKITENGVALGQADGINGITNENGKTVLAIGSGTYIFKISDLNHTVTLSDTSSNTSVSFSEKAKYLTALSSLSDVSLRFNGLTMDYFNANFKAEDNLIEDWSIEGYTGKENTTFKTESDLANLKDMDFWCNSSISGILRSGGTFGTRSDSASGATLTSAGANIGYENTTANPLKGLERAAAGKYDAKVTLALKNKTIISDIYMMGQWTTDLAIPTYEIYVADSEAELYNEENRIALFDYYDGYALDIGVSGEDKPHKLNCKGRNSEGQLWSFGDAKPKGKYVGFKIIDASVGSNASYLAIMDMGVFGAPAGYSVKFNDYNGRLLAETYIESGESASDFAKTITAPSRYGYIFDGWDNNVEEPIFAETCFFATYKRDVDAKYSLKINGEEKEMIAFDTKITASTGQTALWKVNGQNFHIGDKLQAFAFEDMNIEVLEYTDEIKATLPADKAFISLLGAKVEEDKLTAFVHLYSGEEEISEYGATFYDSDDASKFKDLAVSSGNDAMLTLYGISAGSKRSVKGYALGESAIYSENIISAQF